MTLDETVTISRHIRLSSSFISTTEIRIGIVRRIARDGRPKRSLSITVQKTDGSSVTVESSDPIGSPEKPLTNAQLEAKFRDCARNVAKPLSDASLDGLLAAIGRLETLPDARELMTPFAG